MAPRLPWTFLFLRLAHCALLSPYEVNEQVDLSLPAHKRHRDALYELEHTHDIEPRGQPGTIAGAQKVFDKQSKVTASNAFEELQIQAAVPNEDYTLAEAQRDTAMLLNKQEVAVKTRKDRAEPSAGTAQLGRVFMLGNSVTRHYGIFLCRTLGNSLFKSDTDTIADRRAEKRQCKGMLGTDSCILQHCGDTRTVRFMWKNTLGMTKSLDVRDICFTTPNTIACLAELFKGSSKSDLLVIGAMPTNETVVSHMPHYNPYLPFGDTAPYWLLGAEGLDIASLVDSLLSVFPGYIIWHSYPYLVLEKDRSKAGHKCLLACQDQMYKASHEVQAALRGRSERAMYLDLWEYQSRHKNQYGDMIHHPGNLSTHAVNLMVQAWKHYLQNYK